MKTLTPIEKAVVILGLALILVGGYGAVFPQKTVIVHGGEDLRSKGITPGPPEYVSVEKARVYGFISMALGAGICWMARYTPGKQSGSK